MRTSFPELDEWTTRSLTHAKITDISRNNLIKMLQAGDLVLHKNGVKHKGKLIMGRRDRKVLLRHLGVEDVIVKTIITTEKINDKDKQHSYVTKTNSTREIVYEYWDEDLEDVSYFLHKDNTISEEQKTAKKLCDEGKSCKEIGKIMGCSTTHANNLVSTFEIMTERQNAVREYYTKHPDRKPVDYCID